VCNFMVLYFTGFKTQYLLVSGRAVELVNRWITGKYKVAFYYILGFLLLCLKCDKENWVGKTNV
jgi:hypothetical protein